MPEGDTLYRTAVSLGRALVGAQVSRFTTVYPALERVRLEGRTVESVRAVGKHLLIAFSPPPAPESGETPAPGVVLRTHLRMKGSWHLYRPGERWQRPPHRARLVIETPSWIAVGFDVPVAELVDARALPRHRPVASLGPDLLAPAFDRDEAVRRLRAAGDLDVATAILDQRRLAGLGNVYKSEVLFLAGVHPETPVSRLPDETLARIVDLGAKLLRANVAPGARSRQTTGSSFPGARLWVYARSGRPCRRCGTPIAWSRSGEGARSTYHCPTCQPASPRDAPAHRSAE
jgi:endonuclease-8